MSTSRRNMKMTLAAMTLASSMILVDQTAVPLAAPHAILGLHAADLAVAVADDREHPAAGGADGLRRPARRPLRDAPRLPRRRGDLRPGDDRDGRLAGHRDGRSPRAPIQGAGAALMMPTALAIVSAVYPDEEKGAALGILAGASAFFAALGPVLGGVADLDRLAARLPRQRAAGDDRRSSSPCARRRTWSPTRTPRATSTCPASSPSRSPSGRSIFGLSQGPQEGWGEPGRWSRSPSALAADPGLPRDRATRRRTR